MRIRRGGVDRLMRRFLTGTVLILLMLLCGRYISRAAGSITKSDYKDMICAGGQWLVEAIWNQAHPAENAGMSGSWPDAWGSTGAINDPDPAYRKYNAVKTFYEEHQYLAWYGNEESGQQTPEETGIVASGEAGAGTMGASGFQGASQSLEAITGTLERPITGNTYVLEQLMDYDFLIKHFYSVHTSTTAGRDLMNAKDLLSRDMTMKGDDSKPQILIYHTHSQEAYKDSGPGQTVVGVGDYLTRLLEAKGYNVYHDTSVYDLKNGQLDRSKAYNYALDGITNILQQNPSIEVVLDIHRDGVGENLHLVTQVDGRDTAHTDLIALRRGIGYVIQGGALFPHLNVRENIEYVPRLEKNRLPEERIRELMDMAALPMEMLSRNVSELSGGQQQRVGIARALAAQPEIILMDEPFGALDGITRKQLQDEIIEIHRRTGVTIVFVTHDLREAVRLGTWILIMNEGTIVQQGTPQDVRDNPNGDYAQRLLEQLDCG